MYHCLVVKKQYIKPTVEIVVIECPQLMITVSIAESDEVGVGDETVDNSTPDLVVKRRGEWGDLWAEPEDDSL